MTEVRFLAVVGEDGVIRPPAGVILPEGEVEVVIRSTVAPSSSALQPSMKEEDIAAMRAFLLAAAAEAESIEDQLPDDMAENHDHYAHGAPRR